MKQQCEATMAAGAKGVKILLSGRLAGAEIARSETQKLGSIPLQTLDADVDYGVATARTTYGAIGIKVWIYKGKFGEQIEPVRKPARKPRTRRRERGRRRSAVKVHRQVLNQHRKSESKLIKRLLNIVRVLIWH